MAPRIIVRNRPSLSCATCRRRKVKCEKQRPACASCVRLGDQCVYESETEHQEKAAIKKRKMLDNVFLPSEREPDAPVDERAVPPFVGIDFQWDGPNPDFDFDFNFDTNFDFSQLDPSFLLNDFERSPVCSLLKTLPNRRHTPLLPGSSFDGYISTQDDGSELFIERTFWVLVSRDASILLCLVS